MPSDLERFHNLVAKALDSDENERRLIASVINELLIAMRAPGQDREESREVLAELDLQRLTDLVDEQGRSCRAVAAKTLVEMGFPIALEVPPKDLISARQERLLTARCPKCHWQNDCGEHWTCLGEKFLSLGCGHVWNTFETAGKCPKCGRQYEQTACPKCNRSSPHQHWYLEY